jgi:hypothetical protein
MKPNLIGAVMIALAGLGAAVPGWALPPMPAPSTAVANQPLPSLLVRHHGHHWRRHCCHWRWSRDRSREFAPLAIPPASMPPTGSATPPADADPAPSSPTGPPAIVSGGSGRPSPAIRWVDPDRTPR